MSNFSENNDFNSILERLLDNIDSSLDKRQGSIIYDALAPAAAELAQCYIALDVYADQSYLMSATGENLDNRVADFGIIRKSATYARREVEIKDINNELMDVDIGTRFSVPNEYGGYNFNVIEKISTGNYIAECETAGIIGNEYIGQLLPLQSINNLGVANLGIITKPGDNEETDEELLARTLKSINQEAFAGNKAAYQEYVENLDGVESCKVFPVWNGGGTVKLAVVGSGNTIPSSTFIDDIQTLIDPIANQGQGIGVAPIGHTVTVVAPTKLDIDIECDLTLKTGYTISQVQDAVEEQINNYITEIQNTWADNNTVTVYVSRVIAAILNVQQIQNVSNLTINESSSDLVINITGNNVQFPILNEVILNEN